MSNQQVSRKSGARILTSLVIAIILFGGVFSVVQAQDFFPGEDGELRPRGDVIRGPVDMVMVGAGLEISDVQTVILDVPGTTLRAAYLYWSGVRARSGADDYTVTLEVDGVATEVVATTVYGPSDWFTTTDGTAYVHNTYVADVTSLIDVGTQTVTFSDYTVDGSAESKPYGFSLTAVYEAAGLPDSEIRLLDGLDSAYFKFPAPRNGISSLNCINFDADANARVLKFAVLASGVEVSNPVRPNNLYYATATGDPVQADYKIIANPLRSADGAEIDIFEYWIAVPAGHDTACFAVESVNTGNAEPAGASFIWQVGAFNLRDELPTAVNLQSLTAVSSTNNLLALAAVGMLLLTVTTISVAIKRRQK